MKKTNVVWSTEAIVDLEIIYDFLAENSQQAAIRVIECILSRIKQIESFPESGGKQATLRNREKDYRYLVEGNYKIIYWYDKDVHSAYILTIFDTRNNPEKLKV